MIGRLIDANNLIEKFDTNGRVLDPIEIRMQIIHEPTAYDVNKVVKELDEWTFNANVDIGDGTMMNSNLIVRDNAIEIVKAGGIDGDTNI